jgi:hypothetical protein
MSGIHEFVVVEPPTSGEVFAHAAQCLAEFALAKETSDEFPLVPLTVRGDHEVPKPEKTKVTVELRQMILGQNRNTLAGKVAGLGSIVVRMAARPEEARQPATASLVAAQE